MSFDLRLPVAPEREHVKRPAIQTCLEGRWHVYHLTIEGHKDEMEELEEKRKRLGGPAYDLWLTMLLHESRPLDGKLVNKVMHWQLSSLGTQMED